MEPTLKGILDNVKRMVEARILTQDYEVYIDSYICFTYRSPGNTNGMLYAGRVNQFPIEIQEAFLGAYMNDTIGDYKITGVYKVTEQISSR